MPDARRNERSPSQEAYLEFANLIRSNRQFQAGVQEFARKCPELAPLTCERLQQGIPLDVVLAFAALARFVGLGGLREPWFYLVLVMLEYEFSNPPSVDARPASQQKARRPRELKRHISWYYGHHCERKSPVEIAFADGYSLETVQKGLKQARELLRVKKRRGRPPRHHYAP